MPEGVHVEPQAPQGYCNGCMHTGGPAVPSNPLVWRVLDGVVCWMCVDYIGCRIRAQKLGIWASIPSL